MAGGDASGYLGQNPGMLSDPRTAGAVSLMQSLAPQQEDIPAPPEMWDTVQDPYGRGGVGQRSSTTGKIIRLSGSAVAPAASEAPAETWEPVLDTAGNVVAQRNTVTGKVTADPRSSTRGRAGGLQVRAGPAQGVQSRSPLSFKTTQDAFRRVTISADQKGRGRATSR